MMPAITRIFIILTFLPFGVNAQWYEVNSNTTINLKAVHFPISQVGYAVGWNVENSVILKSIDSGLSWLEIDSTHINVKFENVYFLNADTGFVTSKNNLYQTANGGQSWNIIENIDMYDIRDLVFVDDIGFLMGLSDAYTLKIYKSVNAGVNWSIVFQQDSLYFGSMSFVNPNVGYALSGSGAGLMFDKIYKTVNGGSDWQTISFDNQNQTTLQEVFFYDDQTGFSGGYYLNHFMKTLDGGMTWEPINIDDGGMPETFYIAAKENQIYVGNTKIFRSVDFGDSWVEQDLPADVSISNLSGLRDIAIINDSVAVAVAGNGVILRTSNGGNSLNLNENGLKKKIEIFPNPTIDKLTFQIPEGLNLNRILLANSNGQIVETLSLSKREIDTSKLAPGIYFLTIETSEGTITEKVVVAR